MAPRELGGVVDGRLCVYGTKNVRVVDASIMPMHIAAHIVQTVYAVAEKVSNVPPVLVSRFPRDGYGFARADRCPVPPSSRRLS